MQYEHILEIAAHVLDMVRFLMLEIAKKNVSQNNDKQHLMAF